MSKKSSSQVLDTSVRRVQGDSLFDLIKPHKFKDHPTWKIGPGNWGFFGGTNSGKTNALANLLTNPVYGVHTDYDRFIIFSPTCKGDGSWSYFLELHKEVEENPVKDPSHSTEQNEQDKKKVGDVIIYDFLDIAKVEMHLTELTKSTKQWMAEMKKPEHDRNPDLKEPLRVLWVFDDVIGSKEIRHPSMKDLFYRSRHSNSTVYITSQNYRSMPPEIRKNLHYICSLAPRNKEVDQLVEEHCTNTVDEDTMRLWIAEATQKVGDFFFINYKADKEHRFRHNLDKFFKHS